MLSAILDSMPIAVTSIDPKGIVLFANTMAAQNLSRTRESAIGTSIFDYFPDHAPATRERIRQVVSRRTVQHFESVITLPDGRERYFDSAYCPVLDRDGEVAFIQIVAIDVTDIRRHEPAGDVRRTWGVVTDDLSLTARRLKAVLENAPMVVSVYDPDMTIRFMSGLLTGLKLEDVLGRTPIPWVGEASRPGLEEAFRKVREEQCVAECEVEGLSGKSIWLVRLAPLVHEGRVEQILGCSLDITEQKRLQAQVAQKRKIESLGTLASGIAHDFNNLLTAILGNAHLARARTASGDDPTSMLTEIETAATRAAELCGQMLLYAGKDPQTAPPGRPNTVIAEMARLASAVVSTRIRISYDLAEDLPMTRCGRAQLGQVVLNLIKNAADAIGDHDGQVNVSTEAVHLTTQSNDEDYLPGPPPPGRYVCLEISDTGSGMDPETRHSMFDPFYSTKVTGHGLGLSVVMGIVSSQGAAISVACPPGGGTTMTVLFPVHDSPVETVEEDRSASLARGAGGTVLVVDDERAVRRVAVAVLEAVGYDVVEAEDGDVALALLASPTHFRAVVLDVTMPKRDGRSTLRELRRTHPSLPVVLSSGRATEDVAGDPFLVLLPKPYLPAALTKAVEEGIRAASVSAEP